MRASAALAVLATAALSGCASLPPVVAGHESCRADFLGHDARAAGAGATDPGPHRIDGFPYLRSDRFLASFAAEVDDPARFAAWVARLRALDLAARDGELRNTGWDHPAEELAHLDRCGREWAAADLATPRRREQLRERVAVPDDYSTGKRTLGLYPLAAPFLRLGVRGYGKDVARDYSRDAQDLDSPGPLELWRVPAARSAPVRAAPADALGIPELDAAAWTALAQRHAPAWLVERGGDYDRPGRVTRGATGAGVDASQPVTYFHGAYTRFGGAVLRQLVYTVWFGERPARARFDPYAGPLDAVVWRVTLDARGEPLVYDTIHACGCYHYVFAAQPLAARDGGFWQEMPLRPQAVVPREPFAIRLQSGTHYVRRLVPLRAEEASRYALRPYADLLSLAARGGAPRSLFDADGLVDASARGERWWLWPTGIRSPGAMREWGRHATAFVGRRHFDDAFLLEELFEPPR